MAPAALVIKPVYAPKNSALSARVFAAGVSEYIIL
jgi:hypothetical protein